MVRFLQVSGKAHVHESCSTLQGGGVDVGGGGVLESGASTVLDQLKKERKQLWRKTKLSFFRLVWKQREPIWWQLSLALGVILLYFHLDRRPLIGNWQLAGWSFLLKFTRLDQIFFYDRLKIFSSNDFIILSENQIGLRWAWSWARSTTPAWPPRWTRARASPCRRTRGPQSFEDQSEFNFYSV